jgi:hypothetical protein
MQHDPALFRTRSSLIELELRLPDGAPWPLFIDASMKRFIGYYIRVPGIDCGGPLLAYRRAERS